MYDATQILSTHRPLTASSDEFGPYGSVFAPDSDNEVPEPPNLYQEPYHQDLHTDPTKQQIRQSSDKR